MDILEDRIAVLERLVYGGGQVENGNGGRVIDDLVAINNQLTDKVTKHDKIKQTLVKLSTIHKLTDPSNAPSLTLSAEQKVQLITSAENEIRRRVMLLQQVERTRSALDSEHIRKSPSLFPKLAELGTVQAGQIQQANGITEEVSDLVLTYNQLIQSLANQFAFWDKTLTNRESKQEQS